MTATAWKKEIVLAALLLGFGLLLPFAIYWVGQQVIGEYAPEAGALDLAEQIWWELIQLSPAAWALVASPYLFVQLLRVARSSWRHARAH